MRIIAGDFKGRRLYTPVGDHVRPTTDKVKEAIFSMIAFDIPDAVVVDLFAGTGNLGLEALSRGARRCYFGDNSRDSLALVRQNVKYCKAEELSVIIAGDYLRVLDRIKEKADIIFLDPPYKDGLMASCLSRISELELLALEGIIVCEHASSEVMPEEFSGLVKVKEKKYGKIVISIYCRA